MMPQAEQHLVQFPYLSQHGQLTQQDVIRSEKRADQLRLPQIFCLKQPEYWITLTQRPKQAGESTVRPWISGLDAIQDGAQGFALFVNHFRQGIHHSHLSRRPLQDFDAAPQHRSMAFIVVGGPYQLLTQVALSESALTNATAVAVAG